MSSAQSRSNYLVNSCVILAGEPTVGQRLKPPHVLICCGIFPHFRFLFTQLQNGKWPVFV